MNKIIKQIQIMDTIKQLIVPLLTLALILCLVCMARVGYQEIFNEGVCQICGEDVTPIGHSYYTSYYCPQCNRYNK